jgi:PAS domain S-box-containing protein
MNILIVKDNFTQKSLLEEQIRSLGHEVTTCVPGTALERYQQTIYSLIILDVESANLDEVKLCRQIRALPERDRDLILVIARQNDLQQIKAELEVGVDDYLIKPIKVEQLKMRLAAIERQLFRLTQLKMKIKYLTGVLHVIRNTSHLIGKEKDYHRLLQSICDMLAETQGILSVQIKLLDASGFLVKIAESGINQKFTLLAEQGAQDSPSRFTAAPLQSAIAEHLPVFRNSASGTVEPTTSEKITTWLDHDGRSYGLMTVFLSSILASTEEEHGFLKEVAVDIAAALYSIEIDLKRKRTERALLESQARYQELGDTITDPFFVFDKDLILTYWNRAAENFTEIAMPDALGKSVYEIFPNIQGTEAEEGYRKLLETRQPQSFIQKYQLKSKLFFFEVSIYPSRESFSVFAKDITLRKQMEDALKKSWDYLENLNNSLGDAICTVKMPEQVIEYVNRSVENIFGYTVDECIGKHTDMFFPDHDSYGDFSRRLMEAIQQRKDILRTEHVLQRKNGKGFTAEIITTFLREQNTPTGIISIVRDITDRKHMELALEQERASLTRKVEERTAELKRINAELARASQLKDEFLANMSHDLRTPLNAILGYAKILKKTKNLSQLQIEGLETIQSSGEHLLNLINDILDLSKIEAGRLELHPTKFHLPEFLEQIASMIRIRAEYKEIAFAYEHDLNLPVGVCADEKRLREVLINLLDNAVKFTEKGSVCLRVSAIREFHELKEFDVLSSENSPTHQLTNSSTPKTHQLRFEVEDTGPGIAPEQRDEIFLPFQQGGKQRYSSEGTGLGLSISQQLVKMMGGELHVESTVGEGSTFWFELDLPEVPESCLKTRLPQPEITSYRGVQRTVMIVDDNRGNRAVLRGMLLPLGFEIIEAVSGQECLDTATRVKPDVIFLDLRMPGMDGFETAQRIRASPEIRDVTIIAISASVFEETRKTSLESGCNDFLSKPIEEEQLLECLHTHLNLEWIYRDDVGGNMLPEVRTSPISPLTVTLPAAEADILRQLAVCGNITRLLDQLDHIERLGEQYRPLVTELRKLAKSFQVNKIVEYFEQLEKTHER